MSEERATPSSRRDALSAAMDKATEKPAEEVVEKPERVEAAEKPEKAEKAERLVEMPEKAEAGAETAEERAERERDELGRFKARGAEKAEEVKEAPPPKPARKYPSSWKPDYEPTFRELEANEKYRAILDEIERRENDFHKGLEGSKAKAQFADTVYRAIQPYEATIRQMGVAPEQAIQRLFNADHILRYGNPHEKVQHFASLAQSYGVDLAQLAEGAPQVDPQVQQVREENARLQQQMRQFMERHHQQQMSQYASQIEAFKKDHEHFEAVRAHMGALLESSAATDMQSAYDMACWANPDIRARLLAKANAEVEAKRKQEAEAKARAAKAAAVSVKGAPPNGSGSKPDSRKSRRDLIADAVSG